MIELLVVIGVVMILLGLLLPAFESSRRSARAIEGMSEIRQCAILVNNYCADHDGEYPSDERFSHAAHVAHFWSGPLLEGGYFETESEMNSLGADSMSLNLAMSLDPSLMVPFKTLPWEHLQPYRTRQSMVKYPSLLGMLTYTQYDDGRVSGTWCCAAFDDAYVKAPVAFVDGSVVTAYWYELLPDGEFYIENGIGFPAGSTWFGVKGRDL